MLDEQGEDGAIHEAEENQDEEVNAEDHLDHDEENDQGPHLVTSATETKKKGRTPRRTGRKRSRPTPYERKTDGNTDPSPEILCGKIRNVRKRLLPPEDDQKSQELRNELKFLILNHAKLNGLNTESE